MRICGKMLVLRMISCMKQIASKNNNKRKQVISGNDAAGPQLPTNAVSVTWRIFGTVY